MATYKRKTDYFESDEGKEIVQILKEMNNDDAYNTESSYSSDSEHYPDNQIPFVEKHIRYLRSHPSTNPTHYISNLRLMTRIR